MNSIESKHETLVSLLQLVYGDLIKGKKKRKEKKNEAVKIYT